MTEDHIDHGVWEAPEGVMTSAHERTLEKAREAARQYHINSRFVGSWSPTPDLASWSEVYAQEFRDELARLEAAGARPSQASRAKAAKTLPLMLPKGR
jgi:hypothetical protein